MPDCVVSISPPVNDPAGGLCGSEGSGGSSHPGAKRKGRRRKRPSRAPTFRQCSSKLLTAGKSCEALRTWRQAARALKVGKQSDERSVASKTLYISNGVGAIIGAQLHLLIGVYLHLPSTSSVTSTGELQCSALLIPGHLHK